VVTRDDVAARAGTSVAVVSYVVNDGPRPVSAATRARVIAAIEELGYRPNGLARALKRGRTDVIGLLVPDSSNPFFAAMSHAIEERAAASGLVVLLGNSAGSSKREEGFVRALLEQRVDGIVLLGTEDEARASESLSRFTVPVVSLHRTLPWIGRRSGGWRPSAVVSVDNEKGADQATAHLREHGHTRIACIAGPEGGLPSDERIAGWRAALGNGSGPLLRQPFTREGGYRAAQALFDDDEAATAVFVCSDEQAIGVLRYAAEAGRRVPTDMALVSFDGTRDGLFTTPSLTSVVQPMTEIAQISVDQIMSGLDDATTTPGHVHTLPMQLRVGESCGCTSDHTALSSAALSKP
jgi:LacI family transcriptional regulator, galactose operon repressor